MVKSVREERKTLFQMEECKKILIENLIEKEYKKFMMCNATGDISRDEDEIHPKSFFQPFRNYSGIIIIYFIAHLENLTTGILFNLSMFCLKPIQGMQYQYG